MVKKTVLKVNINCDKCKKELLKAVSSLQGVDKIEVDEAKGTLTVTGDADPYEIIVRTRKAGKYAQVVSIGPPPPPPKHDAEKKPQEKKPEEKKKSEEKKPEEKKKPVEKKPDPVIFYPMSHVPHHYWPAGHQVAVVHMDRHTQWDEYDPNPSCYIM